MSGGILPARPSLRDLREARVGLALGSGGARGWAHLGAWAALGEYGIAPCCIAGTSMGALVGAFLAAGRYEQLLEATRLMSTWRKALAFFFEVSPSVAGITKARRVMHAVEDLLGVETFEELPVPFACVATDLRTGDPVVLSSGPLVPAIRASIAIPGIFTPVELGGRTLVDGGLVDPVPVGAARKLGAGRVIAVDVSADAISTPPVLPRPFPVDGAPNIVMRAIRIAESQIAAAALRADPPDLLATPALGHIGTLDFHRSAEAIPVGHDTLAALLRALPGG